MTLPFKFQPVVFASLIVGAITPLAIYAYKLCTQKGASFPENVEDENERENPQVQQHDNDIPSPDRSRLDTENEEPTKKKSRITKKHIQHLQKKINKLLSKIDDYNDFDGGLKPEQHCVVCLSHPAQVLTSPCHHCVTCRRCFLQLMSHALKHRKLPLTCVVCREKVLHLDKVSAASSSRHHTTNVTGCIVMQTMGHREPAVNCDGRGITERSDDAAMVDRGAARRTIQTRSRWRSSTNYCDDDDEYVMKRSGWDDDDSVFTTMADEPPTYGFDLFSYM